MAHRYLLVTYKDMVDVCHRKGDSCLWPIELALGKTKGDGIYVRIDKSPVFLSPGAGLYADIVKKIRVYRAFLFSSSGVSSNVRPQV